jgi:hypothetical protein
MESRAAATMHPKHAQNNEDAKEGENKKEHYSVGFGDHK